MSKKMALVPPDLVSEYYQINKPEIRLEDKIIQVLHQNEMPDDLRGKLLSQLIPKYQKSMIPPKTFELPPELFNNKTSESSIAEIPESSFVNKDVLTPLVAKFVIHAVAKSKKKHIVPILEKLRNIGYQFNERNELEVNGKPEHRSNAIDLFGYLMRDMKNEEPPPRGFENFLRGVFEANIPRQWIGNKYVRNQLELSILDPRQPPYQASTSASTPEKNSKPDEASTPYQPSPSRKKLKWIQYE